MPSNIKHILKIWGKGGVEDYITSLLATKISNQQVVLCSQFSFLEKRRIIQIIYIYFIHQAISSQLYF